VFSIVRINSADVQLAGAFGMKDSIGSMLLLGGIIVGSSGWH